MGGSTNGGIFLIGTLILYIVAEINMTHIAIEDTICSSIYFGIQSQDRNQIIYLRNRSSKCPILSILACNQMILQL